jgi:Holliday junction resolvase RusA-like endonuclease
LLELILEGQPRTKKNSQIPTRSGIIIQSKAYREYDKLCRDQIRLIYKGEPITDDVILDFKYWMQTRRFPDLCGLLQATCDILGSKKNRRKEIIVPGVLLDDSQVKWFADSRIMGVDRENPRVEIKIFKIF